MTTATPEAAAPEVVTVGPLPAGTVDPKLERLIRRMTHPLVFPLFLLFKLPLALVAGLRVRSLTAQRCEASVPYRWLTTNPFKSTYFAALSMAAELSTGALAMLAVEAAPESVAMLIVGLEAQFGKKAVAKATFTCEQGDVLFAAVRETLRTGEPVAVEVETVGRLPDGAEVARFAFTWSFKRRSKA